MSPSKGLTKDGGFFRGVADQLKLIWYLWKDPRISPLLKLLPFGSIIYLISPLDIAIPVIDDVGVLLFFTNLFVELCPEDIVEEHRKTIRNTVRGEWAVKPEIEFSEEEISDAEFKDKI